MSDGPMEDEDEDGEALAGDHHDYEYDPGDLIEHRDFANDEDFGDRYDGCDE